MQHVILAIALIFSSLIFAQTQENKRNLEGRSITVTVMNALNDTGTVNFALFNEVGFRKQPVLAKSAVVEKGGSTIIFSNVMKGEYAIICYHDENENSRMDFHENGMPK